MALKGFLNVRRVPENSPCEKLELKDLAVEVKGDVMIRHVPAELPQLGDHDRWAAGQNGDAPLPNRHCVLSHAPHQLHQIGAPELHKGLRLGNDVGFGLLLLRPHLHVTLRMCIQSTYVH